VAARATRSMNAQRASCAFVVGSQGIVSPPAPPGPLSLGRRQHKGGGTKSTIMFQSVDDGSSKKIIKIKLTKESLFGLVEGDCIKVILKMEASAVHAGKGTNSGSNSTYAEAVSKGLRGSEETPVSFVFPTLPEVGGEIGFGSPSAHISMLG